MRFSPLSQGTANSITALTRKFGQAITEVAATVGQYFADGLFVVQAEATPTGAESRISLSVKASAEDANPSEASLYLDALAGGASRIVMAADRTVIEDSAGNILACWGADGYIEQERIAKGTVTTSQFYQYPAGGSLTQSEVDYTIPSETDLFTAHAGKKCFIQDYLGGGLPVPDSQLVVATFSVLYKPTTTSVYVCHIGLEGKDSAGNWFEIPGSFTSQTTQSLSSRQTISVSIPVKRTDFVEIKPFIAAGTDDVDVKRLSFELRTLYK